MKVAKHINVLSENNPPSPSKKDDRLLLARVIECQAMISRNIEISEARQAQAEERHRENIALAEARTQEIINAQRALFIAELQNVRFETFNRIEVVEEQVKELRQTVQQLNNQSSGGNEPGELTTGQLEFTQRNPDGTRDGYQVSFDQFSIQGKLRGVCPFCRNDYAKPYLKRHIINTCFKNFTRNSNNTIPSNYVNQ